MTMIMDRLWIGKFYMGPSTNHVDSFLGFFDPPPPPLWTNMDILGTPLPVHVDFSMTPPPFGFISKKNFKLPIYWNFKIQT